ncbi:TPA: hypothetical protein OMU28_002042 [Klebsiella aerogenes]|nr:hypothetical protein [Klebsiella aerogenes]
MALGSGSLAIRDNSVAVGGRQLTGLSAGTEKSDAVNIQQLTDTAAQTLADAGDYTDYSVSSVEARLNASVNTARNEAITTSNQYSTVSVARKELNTTIDTASSLAVSASSRYTDSQFQQGR